MQIFAILFPVWAFAWQVSDPQLVRRMDGHAYNCVETYEAGKTAYRPVVAELSSSAQEITLTLRVTFQVCVRNGNSVHWEARGPLDPIDGVDLDGRPQRIEYRDAEILFGNANLTRLRSEPLLGEREATVTYRFVPADFLTAVELADLAAGKPVRARFGIIQRAIGKAVSATGELPLGYLFGGTYTFFLTLQR